MDPTNALDVVLTSSDTSEAAIQPSVTIPAGQSSVTVDLNAVDDFDVDGTQTVMVTAEAILANSGGPVGLDLSFRLSGLAATALQSNYQPPKTAFGILADGKTIAASEGPLDAGQIRLVRHNTDGTPDTTFGTNGLLIVDVATNNPVPTDILVQPDGKMIVGGEVIGGSTLSFLARVNSDGTLDSTFGTGGIADLQQWAPGKSRIWISPTTGRLLRRCLQTVVHCSAPFAYRHGCP